MKKSMFVLCVLWTILGVVAFNLDVVGAFASGAPGDFPWEDIFHQPLADKVYEISHVFEAARDYFAAIQEDGDYNNDWLTHLPCPGLFELAGRILAE